MENKQHEDAKAYLAQYNNEEELRKEGAIDFAEWLFSQGITYVDNTTEGNIYMVESNMNRRMTMEQIYELYLNS